MLGYEPDELDELDELRQLSSLLNKYRKKIAISTNAETLSIRSVILDVNSPGIIIVGENCYE